MSRQFEIVECPVCGQQEYYGMMHWHNGQTMCRSCIYRIWSEEEDANWRPGENDYIFPLYDDGNCYVFPSYDDDCVMHTYYVSLVRGLSGYYVKFRAPTEEIVRMHLSKYFGRMWCSVYTQDEIVELANKYTVNVINEENPICLLTAEWEY